jgi:hypothetical protein
VIDAREPSDFGCFMRYAGAVKQIFRLAAAALGVAASAITMGPGAAAQDRPAGLVMTREGTATPDVAPFTELTPRSTIALDAGSRMSFVHYGTCRLVTVEGGRLYIDAQRYSLAGGRIAGVEPTDCPREQKLASGGGDRIVSAVLVMRGTSGTPRLRPYPRIVLTGAVGATFNAAELRREGRTLGAMTVRGRLASWPETNPPLAPGSGYVARLTRDSGSPAIDLEFSVAEPGTPSDAAAILRLE